MIILSIDVACFLSAILLLGLSVLADKLQLFLEKWVLKGKNILGKWKKNWKIKKKNPVSIIFIKKINFI